MQKRKAAITDFAVRLEREWRRLGLPYQADKIVVAVSGGADSTALLLALHELTTLGRLSLKILIAHLDHRLRKGSKEDALWVEDLARTLDYQSILGTANVRQRAKSDADNLEQAARNARYEFFSKVAEQQRAGHILTAHTLDDQAETLLLRLLRGSGAEGLSGIEPVRPVERGSDVLVVRPLLSWARREETQSYCRARRVRFRVDEMNEDEQFTRVRVRKLLLPLMKSFNNRIVEALGRTTNLLREDAQALSDEAELLVRKAELTGKSDVKSVPELDVRVLQKAPLALTRRAIRIWIRDSLGDLRRLEMVHFLAVERLISGTRGGTIELPNGLRIIRKRSVLSLMVKTVEKGGSGV